MGTGIGLGFSNAMKNVTKDMNKAIPTDFGIDTSISVNKNDTVFQSLGSSKSVIEHKGVIEVRGVNSKNELTNVVEIIMNQFRREARI